MKILHTIWSASFGGIERLVLDLGTEQVARGMDVGILICSPVGKFLAVLRESPMECHIVGMRHGADIRPTRVRQMTALMNPYDIVHLHTFTPAVALGSVAARSKIVYTEHGNFGFGRTRSLSDRIKAPLRRIFLNRYVNHITFNSQFTRELAEARYGLKSTARSVVYNGASLDPSRMNPPSVVDGDLIDELSGRFVVGTTSRFAGVKRIDRLIRAFASFCREKAAVLLLVGDGEQRRNYEILVDRLRIRDRVIFAGFQSNIAGYQQLMDVCVFPSQGEAFGLAAVETLALGKPTIVLEDGGGIKEVIRRCNRADIVNGVDGLVRRLDHYYGLRHEASSDCEARRNVARNFSIETMAHTLNRIYCQILSQRGVGYVDPRWDVANTLTVEKRVGTNSLS